MIPHQKAVNFSGERVNYSQPTTEQSNPQKTDSQHPQMIPVPGKPPLPHSQLKSVEKHSMIGSSKTLTFSGGMGTQSQPFIGNKEMARSQIGPQTLDLDSFKRQILMKFHQVHRTLSEHAQLISDFRQNSLNSTNSSVDYKDSLTSDMLRNLRKDFEFDQHTLQNRIKNQIDNLKVEINDRFLKRQQLDTSLKRFETKLGDSFVNINNYTRGLNEVRQKTSQECKNIFQYFKRQNQSNILHIHDANRLVFSKIQKDIIEMRSAVDTNRQQLSKLKQSVEGEIKIFSSGRRFYDPRIIKYKEVLQRQGDKPGEEITFNQVTYYLDKEGYLLDRHSNYLVDHNNQTIQLQQKHLSVLRIYGLLD